MEFFFLFACKCRQNSSDTFIKTSVSGHLLIPGSPTCMTIPIRYYDLKDMLNQILQYNLVMTTDVDKIQVTRNFSKDGWTDRGNNNILDFSLDCLIQIEISFHNLIEKIK